MNEKYLYVCAHTQDTGPHRTNANTQEAEKAKSQVKQ
jgi:hypothetical protein